ncbi:Non-catalytic module family DOC2, partial [Piromyces sp. E2]
MESVLLTGNEKEKYFILFNNSRFTVFIESYPGYTWILENLEEVKKADIEPLNLMPSHYGNEPNAGEYINGYPQDEALGGYTQFIFKKNNLKINELPTLKFVYKNDSNPETKDIYAQVNLIKGEGEPLSLGLINDSTTTSIKITEEGGKYDLYVNNNSSTIIFLYGSISNDNTLSSGYSWYMENTEMIKSNPFVDFLELDTFANRPGSYYNPMTTLYKYIFQVNDYSAKDVLPTLVFSYKESAKSSSRKARAVVHLRSFNETIVTFDDNDTGYKKNLNVDKNEVLLVEFSGSPSTGYNWILDNAEEVKAAKGIEALNIDANGRAPFTITTENRIGSPGVYRFKFQIEKDAEAGELQPTLKFIQARSKNNVINTAELALRVKKERKEEDFKDMSLPVIIYDKNTNKDNVIYVESNTIIQFTEESNPSTGCSWIIKNQEEIERSDFIDYLGSTFKSHCEKNNADALPWQMVSGCGGDETFSFRVWDIQDSDDLPEIHMVYGHSWAIDTEYYETVDLVLKVKKADDEKEKEKDKEELDDLPVIVYDKKVNEDNIIYIESNTIVQFTEESNPSTGCSWIIKNQEEIDHSDLVKYIGSTYKSHCENSSRIGVSGCGGDETFKFLIGDIQEGDELPEIHMVYGHSWAIDTEYYETVDLVLKVKKADDEKEKEKEKEKEEFDDLPVIVYDKKVNEDNVIYVESNTIVQFTEESNPSTGCSWIIKNQEDIDQSDLVKYIGSTFKSHCENSGRIGVSGCGGDETFKFLIGDVKESDELPEIHMVYGHRWAIDTEYYETVDLILKVKKADDEKEKEGECTFNGYPCCTQVNPKVRYQDKDGDWGEENGEWCFIKKEEEKEKEKQEKDEPKLIRTCTGENLGYPCCEKEHKNIYTDDD